ncbi:MAG: MFS transporter [Vicinamibacterales bacterium]
MLRLLTRLPQLSGRAAVFTLLYAAEGAPIGFIWWALPAMLRADGVAIERITGLTAVLLLPWVFKFAWAPLVDALRSPRWGFRAWIMSAQVLMGLTLAPLIWLSPADHFEAWRLLLLLHAFAAATQDVAIDALAINSVPPAGRGFLNGCMQAGMLMGRSVFGGGALLAAAWFGRPWLIAALVVWVWLPLPVVLFLREPAAARAPLTGRARAFGAVLGSMFRTRTMWLGLAFALVSAAAFEATGQLAGPFLIDRGVAGSTIGVFFGLFVVAATLAGGLIGGRMSDRQGRIRTVAVFLVGFVAMIAALAAADLGGGPPVVLMALLTGMYFFVGLFTAASYALFMDLTDPRTAGTQFSTFMAATNGCESWSALAGGRVAGGAGYPAAFLVMSVVSLASLPLLRALRREGRTGEANL